MRFFYITVSFLLITVSTFTTGCSGTTESNNENAGQPAADNVVKISKMQFNAENMKVANTINYSFSRVFNTNGIVTASPQDRADVYVYVSGIIKTISVNLGSFVRKGEQLCTFESKEFINMQQQYLVSEASLKATKANYERVKSLYSEKVASQKDFFAIESEYKMLNAKLKALKAELKILNVNMENLEAGNIATYLTVSSPIEGYITRQLCSLGEFVDSQKLLFKIVDNRNLQLHFFVYQENIGSLKKGQLLKVYSPDNREKSFNAQIISIGKTIDEDTKSIRCIAKLEPTPGFQFISGMYFQVDVEIDSQEAIAIQSEAVMKIEDKYYILVKEKDDDENIFFIKKEVIPGLVSNGFTQIVGDKNFSDVLVKGTYYYEKE